MFGVPVDTLAVALSALVGLGIAIIAALAIATSCGLATVR
jgi:hypothetical protein